MTLNVNALQRNRIVREAAKAGLNIANPELKREVEKARSDAECVRRRPRVMYLTARAA